MNNVLFCLSCGERVCPVCNRCRNPVCERMGCTGALMKVYDCTGFKKKLDFGQVRVLFYAIFFHPIIFFLLFKLLFKKL